MNRPTRTLLFVMASAAGAVAFGGVASAQSPPTFDAPDTATPGETITLSGGGCTGNFGVASVWQSTGEQVLSARVPVQQGGTWEGSVMVPADAQPGRYTLLVVCLNTDQTVFSYAPHSLDVAAPTGQAVSPAAPAAASEAATPVAAAIPVTGSMTGPTLAVGAALLAGGGALVLAASASPGGLTPRLRPGRCRDLDPGPSRQIDRSVKQAGNARRHGLPLRHGARGP